MSKDDLSKRIIGLSDSLRDLVEAATSEESKRSGFATIQEYVDATRYRTESFDGSRAEYYTFALNKLREQDPRVGAFLPLHFISTLNKTCSVVDIGAGPVLLIDLYQSEILEEMGRLFFAGGPTEQSRAMALRLLAEHLLANGKEKLATHFAVRRSILMEDCQQPELSVDEQTEVDRCSALQDVYVLTHEIGHILWSRGQVPEDFISRATQWIALDASLMAHTQARIAGRPADLRARLFELKGDLKESECVAGIMSALSSSIQKSGYAPDQLRATVERRCDPSSGFIEEVLADLYAWVSCMQLFSGNWPAQEVYRDLTLALRNLATIDAMRRVAEHATDPQTLDDASTRRCVLRLGLRTLFGDLRESDDFRNAISLREEADLEVDFVTIGVETEQRYNQVLWNPMSACSLAESISAPGEHELASRYASCQQKFGPNPTLKILRDNPINSSNESRSSGNALSPIR